MCGNPVCGWSEDRRYFKWVWAISMRTGALRHAIDLYKVEGVEGWAWIFGRVFVGYLNAHRDTFERYDLIIPSPTYIGPGGRAFDHTAKVVERAIVEDTGSWPFQLGVVTKTAPTKAFRGRTWPQRHAIATGELRNALVVPKPEFVEDKRILVYDDVYTEGLTLREVARVLRNSGSQEVSEIVLARQPFTGAPPQSSGSN